MSAVVALAGVFATLPAHARCLGTWFHVVNAEAPIATNGRILVEGFAQPRELLDDIATRKPVLRNRRGGKDIVPLRVVETRRGEVARNQVLLEPERPLLPSQTYRLDFVGLPDDTALYVKTAAGPDTTAPSWNAPTTVRERARVGLGCGPSVFVTLAVGAADDSGYLLAHVEVKRLRDGHTAAAFVAIEDGTIAVGHGMCGGMFRLDAGAAYEIRTAVVDSAGNGVGDPSSPVSVIAP